MTLSRAEASAALTDVAAAQKRSEAFRFYQTASPHLIIWGVAWAAAYSIGDLRPGWNNLAWSVIAPLAVIGDILAARSDAASEHGGTVGALFGIVAVFVVSTIAIMAPSDPRQVGAFIPLVVAAGYAILGLMGAPRLLVLGGTLAVLVVGGFFALPTHFSLWMAVCGGGALLLGGFWLRQA
jgi:hypothetical protein